MKKLLFIVNVDWFFISHRLVIAEEAKKNGFEILIAAEDTGRSNEIIDKGFKFINLPISRSGTNIFHEFITFLKMYFIYIKYKPDIVHHVTLKPVIYGSIISKWLKISAVVNAISGLGYNFTSERSSVLQKFMILAMKYGFNRKNITLIFQNKSDQEEFENYSIITSFHKIVIIKGSGVDLNLFCHSNFPSFSLIKILLPCRMLWDKGVKELYYASIILKEKYINKIQFILAGSADDGNKSGVPESFLHNWHDNNYVMWIGYKKNMVEVYKDSHIVVLPSYREGMPKSLLEACSIGRPIITTNAIGCNECVDEGVNGFKVDVKNVNELVINLEKLINNTKLIQEMGIKSRIKAENEFDLKFVIKKHIEIYKNLI